MTQTQEGANMVHKAEEQGMLGPEQRIHTAKPTKTQQERQTEQAMDSTSAKSPPGTTTSEQDSAFKKENDAETPSPSDPENRT